MSNLIKSTSEENSNFEAPLKDYTESNLMREQFAENEQQNLNKDELQKPVFVNPNLENKPNFKDLKVQEDVK